MTKELKQEFTLRITQANKTQLITILYEMVLLYVKEAEDALETGDKRAYKDAIRKIRDCMNELTMSLHLEYELARNLLQLYLYISRELVQASIHFEKENLAHIKSVIKQLHKAYKQIEPQDVSGPVMGNTQAVYAGLTYGRNTLTESVGDPAGNRGFCV
ncbi:MAG: flagellar export chaperone FliS [Roseburia sp.]|nr:flagellar export chaperone FliS [Ruminococcus sp.]MCM1155656.1 flagellar export chaperone FliS [Roseburia sp.]MCM1241647.1 flagellar export chaperone FliS [Roseburia sp.]